MAEVTERTIPGPATALPIRVYRPSIGAVLPGLVWYHGGGWVFGDLDMSDGTCRALANAAECVVVSVDYRLAPETPFPGAVDDAYAAVDWVAEHADQLGIDPDRIAVGGDSAGGNLAAAVCLIARERGRPAICHQVLVYPVTDHRLETESYQTNGQGYLLTRTSMEWFWGHYLGDQDRAHPLASPLLADSLAMLPSATVVTAEFDPLRDEGEAYGERLRGAGILTTITRYHGMIHGFFGMADVIQAGRTARAQVAEELRVAFLR